MSSLSRFAQLEKGHEVPVTGWGLVHGSRGLCNLGSLWGVSPAWPRGRFVPFGLSEPPYQPLPGLSSLAPRGPAGGLPGCKAGRACTQMAASLTIETLVLIDK